MPRKIEYGTGKRSQKLVRFAESHDWTCWICGYAIPRDFVPNSPLGPSGDHFIPRNVQEKNRGIPNNKRLAHRWCNSKRLHEYPLSDATREEIRKHIRTLLAERITLT